MSMATFLDEYAALTAEMQFEVARSDGAGKCIVAKEDLEPGVELIEELPLISWPIPTTAVGMRPKDIHEGAFKWQGTDERLVKDGTDAFCDVCLCVFGRECAHVVCEDASCGARFCSGACSESRLHRALCGSFRPLRQWQAQAAIDSQFGAEAIARANAAITARVLDFVSSVGLSPDEALLNALRPWERICAFPEACQLTLKGASAEGVANVLLSSTSSNLATLLATGMEQSAALAIATELCSVAHVEGLMQRLLLNSFTWGYASLPSPSVARCPAQISRVLSHHPPSSPASFVPPTRHPTDRTLRFGGMFMMMSNANHSCAPTAEIRTEWTRAVEEGSLAVPEADADDNGPSKPASGGPSMPIHERSGRMHCSFTLRTRWAGRARTSRDGLASTQRSH